MPHSSVDMSTSNENYLFMSLNTLYLFSLQRKCTLDPTFWLVTQFSLIPSLTGSTPQVLLYSLGPETPSQPQFLAQVIGSGQYLASQPPAFWQPSQLETQCSQRHSAAMVNAPCLMEQPWAVHSVQGELMLRSGLTLPMFWLRTSAHKKVHKMIFIRWMKRLEFNYKMVLWQNILTMYFNQYSTAPLAQRHCHRFR